MIMRIINIGSLNLDYVYRVNQFLLPGETKSSLSLDVNAGGKGLNQSIAMAKAGCEVYHAGVYGAGGEMLVQTLTKYGVDVHLMQQRTDIQNGHAIIQVADSGQNCILLYGGSNQALTEDYIRQVIGFCGADDMILLQNEINNIDLIIDLAYEKHIPVAMNIAPMGPEVAGYDLNKLTWIVVNEIEGAALAGGGSIEETMENLCAKYPNCGVLMTLGSEGVWLKKGDTNIRMNALKVENVVDTTAAGDTFLGYFLAGITRKSSMVDALQQATCASALAIQKVGAAQSIPDPEELMAFWEKNKEKLVPARG